MRVGLLIYGSLDTISGGYLYDRQLVATLHAQGDHVEIISLPWRNYPHHLLDNFSSTLLQRLQRLSIDVLIQDELNHPSLAWLNHRLQTSYPILSLVHHMRCDEQRPGWQNVLYRQIEKRYLESVDGFIFNSQTTRLAVDRVSSIKDRPWVIATPAGDRLNPDIHANEIIRRAHQTGPLRLVFLGSLIPRKGLHTLIEALARLPKDSYSLDVIGNSQGYPAYTRRLHRMVKQLGLTSRVRLMGSQQDAAIANVLRESQVLVVPSSYEGFGIVYLEGMGYGLPAIGTTQGAAAEIIDTGENGYLIDPEDSANLAAILEKLHLDRQHLSTLSLAAHQRYHQFPGWEQSMETVRAFLLEMIGKR